MIQPGPLVTFAIFIGSLLLTLAFLWVCVRGLKGKR